MPNSPRRMVPISSYRATRYVVLDGGREVTIRLESVSPEFDAVLMKYGATSGICITAANPLSERQSEDVNAAANARLARVLGEGGWQTLPHAGRSPDGTWVEEGFFVLDLDENDGVAIAERFGQFGIVAIGRGERARLILTRLAEIEAENR